MGATSVLPICLLREVLTALLRPFFLFLGFVTASTCLGQARIQGRVMENGFGGLANATVVASSLQDSTSTAGTSTNRSGFFDLGLDWSGATLVRISHVGFRAFEDTVAARGRVDFGVVTLFPEVIDLEEVEVQARRERMTINGDTVEFYAGGFYVPRYTYAESLVKALPGFEVIGGVVYHLGKPVDRVLVDGRAYFGTDVMDALATMPIEIIESLQVYEQLPDDRKFSGVDNGDREQVINLVTDPEKRRTFITNVGAAGGTADRYSATAGLNFLEAPLWVRGNISSDNTAQQSSQGISRNSQGQLGFGNTWNENTRVNATFLTNDRDRRSQSDISRSYLGQEGAPSSYSETRTVSSDALTHTLTGSVRHTIRDRHQITFNPRLLVMDNAVRSSLNGLSLDPLTGTAGAVLSGSETSSQSVTGGFSADWQVNNAETLSLMGSLNLSFSDDETNGFQTDGTTPESSFLSTTDTRSRVDDLSVDASLGGMRKLGENGFLSLNVDVSESGRVEDRLAFTQSSGSVVAELDSTLSNDYDGSSSGTGVNLHYGLYKDQRGFDFNLGVRRNTRRFSQTFPVEESLVKTDYLFEAGIGASRNLEGIGNLKLDYGVTGSTPSGDELSLKVDNSNPLFLSVGNPDLAATIRHRSSVSLNIRRPESQIGGGLNLNLGWIQDVVGNEVYYAGAEDREVLGIRIPAGGQLARDINLGDEQSAVLNASMTRWTEGRSGGVTLGLNGEVRRRPVSFDGVTSSSLSRTLSAYARVIRSLSGGTMLIIDYNLRRSAVSSDLVQAASNDYISHRGGLRVFTSRQRALNLSSDLTLNVFERFGSDFDSRTLNWTAGVTYRPTRLEQLLVSVTVRDILDSGSDIERTVSNLYLESRRTSRLGRHLLFRMTWELRRFGPGR